MLINEYKPDRVTPPGKTMREAMAALGMKEIGLADRLGMSTKAISEMLNNKKPITPETANNLELVLGIPASFWNNREMRYREYLLSLGRKKSFDKYIAWAQEFPIKQLKQLKAIPSEAVGGDLVAALCKFFRIASPERFKDLDIAQVSYRRQKTTDEKALISWLRLGETAGRAVINCKPYNHNLFKANLLKIRELIHTADAPKIWSKVESLCADSGVIVMIIPEMPGAKVCGSSRWLEPDKALIQLSLRFKDSGNLWFTFFHEAAHILYAHTKKQILINAGPEEHCVCKTDEARESEANKFASDILIPPHVWKQFAEQGLFTPRSVVCFSEAIKIPAGIVVGRLQHENRLGWQTPLNRLKTRYKFCLN